jgi:uncharacterized repeat protein (TIGR03803 family)
LKTVYIFKGGLDGSAPLAGVIRDNAGNLYGTTSFGGTADQGTAFKISPEGAETILHSFAGFSEGDGSTPKAALIRDSAGNLYGTTEYGSNHEGAGTGTVFKLDSAGAETILHYFSGSTDGADPVAALLLDSAGNLYGTTMFGGLGYGTVFKVAATGGESVLYAFTGKADGSRPLAALVSDSSGNLYGTTQLGGTDSLGVVFKLASSLEETVLHNFDGSDSDETPTTPLLRVGSTLYGTTSGVAHGGQQGGTVFEINSRGQEKVVHQFVPRSKTDGSEPSSGVVRDSAGNLYGTTASAGASGFGTVWKVDTSGHETILYNFTGGTDGKIPYGIIRDAKGNLYGVTQAGGDTTGNGCSCGTVWELTF